MRSRFKALMIAGSLLTASLGASASATAATTPALTRAVWSPNSVNKTLQIQGFDVSTGATYTEYATSSGPGSITLKDSLGGSVTIPLTANTKYS